jgi:hypothetical protein
MPNPTNPGKRWTVQDRSGNSIYLTEERWEHIIKGHPEMTNYEKHLKATIRKGRRRQEPLNPRKYRYAHPFTDLPEGFNHLVAIVLFGFNVDKQGNTFPNNFVVTAFVKHIHLKGGRSV